MSEVNQLKIIILAGGKGKRLQSETADIPKVLRHLAGKPLLSHVLENITITDHKDRIIVVGYQKEKIISAYASQAVFCTQSEQLGTGHAVMCCEEALKNYTGEVMIIYGDMPLFRAETLREMIAQHYQTHADATIMTAIFDQIPPYGRIIRNDKGEVKQIIEEKDCSPEEKQIREVNVGVVIIKNPILFNTLHLLKNNNAQQEYYLTDLAEILIQQGYTINSYLLKDNREALGINTEEDLKTAEIIIKTREI